MSDNIRTALYDADYTVTLAGRASEAAGMLCRIVGNCESGDIVIRDAWLPDDLAVGDVIAACHRRLQPIDGEQLQHGSAARGGGGDRRVS